jgi:Alcohol dehydrogenase GroES-like domain
LVATGVCHTDTAIRDHTIVPMAQPIVMGHEGSGIIEAVGVGVTEDQVGNRVILSGVHAAIAAAIRPASHRIAEFFLRNFGGGRFDGTSLLSVGGERFTRLWGRGRSPRMWFATIAMSPRSVTTRLSSPCRGRGAFLGDYFIDDYSSETTYSHVRIVPGSDNQ